MDTPYFAPVVVITPVYNGAEFLAETLDAVQEQTYPNLTHFVLDNASTDGTAQILSGRELGRVPLITRRNDVLLPIADNWNEAARLGVGIATYFRFLCADDTLPPDAIEKMVALAESDPAINVVACQRQTDAGVESLGWDPKRSVYDGREALRSCFLGVTGLAASHFLYRSGQRNGQFFDDSILHFDTDAGFRLLAEPGAKLGVVHQPLGFTREHDDTVTQREVNAKHTNFLDWYVLVQRYAGGVLSSEEMVNYMRAFRRHYFGRMLAWRFADRNALAYDWHIRELQARGAQPTLSDFGDALLDYGLRKIGMRTRWDHYPQG
ncbi:glycosyltransferase family 2 protein [Hyphomicrobium sp. NDB2Meth4]|uniref:glycosyltransferase family 2 protein n=1 Tax=Hyphomicrobium sp. NDB2Meth4 TaxID=1892846 RepID=UPI00093174B7|nr:glycosyltransferase family 2 protein [Hyphomicrobium sp. NDB2Meth4]